MHSTTTGFSFTEEESGYSTTSRLVAENVYEFLQQFFLLFPELQPNPFYVGGISYGGKPLNCVLLHLKSS
jgi:vitellogenic carboxypeptidase-like protein